MKVLLLETDLAPREYHPEVKEMTTPVLQKKAEETNFIYEKKKRKLETDVAAAVENLRKIHLDAVDVWKAFYLHDSHIEKLGRQQRKEVLRAHRQAAEMARAAPPMNLRPVS